MDRHRRRALNVRRIISAGVLLASAFILASCGSAGELSVPLVAATVAETTATVVVTAVPSETIAGSQTPAITPSPNYKEVAIAQWTQTMVAIRTSVAETALPTWTPGVGSPGPSATPELGMALGCVSENTLEPQFVTCWAGVYNGRIVNVWTGNEGRAGDPTQGVVLIHTRDTTDTQTINTPRRVGAVQITAVNGTLFTLTTTDHQPPVTFYFDLITRQWLDPNGTPIPSPTFTPTP